MTARVEGSSSAGENRLRRDPVASAAPPSPPPRPHLTPVPMPPATPYRNGAQHGLRARACLVVVAAAAAALLTACSGASAAHRSAPAPGDTVAIGIAVDEGRDLAESSYRGVELAIAHLNAAGGTPFTMRRPPASARGAVAIATALRDDPDVVAVVGHPESGSTLDALPVYEDAERGGERALAAVSPTATSPALSGRSPWFFRVCPTDVEASRAVARFVGDSLGARRAAVVYYNDSYGRDWTKAFAATYQAAGGTLVLRAPYLPDVAEWPAYAAHLERLGADVLLFPGDASDAAEALRALRAAGSRIRFIGGDATSGLEESAAEFAGARYTAFFDPRQARTPTARRFVEEYQARWGTLPDQRAALAYDAATLIGTAVRESGADRRRVRDYLEGVGSDHPAVDGATGTLAFDARHDALNKTVVVTAVGAR